MGRPGTGPDRQIHPDDQASVDEWCATLDQLGEWQGDDGMFWLRRMLVCGLDIYEVQLDPDQRPHVRLYNGSWLVFDCDGTDLAEEAFMRGILDLEARLLPEHNTWKSLGVRAISIVNSLPE